MIGLDFSFASPALGRRSDILLDLSASLPVEVAFSRGSLATYFDDSGQITHAEINKARFEFDPVSERNLGILLEGSSENLIPFSRANTTNWIKDACNATALNLNACGEFDGVEVVSTGMIWGRLKTVFDVTAGQAYAVSAFYRRGTSAQARFAFSGLGGGETHFSGQIGNLAETRTQLGNVTNTSQEILADNLTHRVRFLFTPNSSGQIEFGLGPQSGTAGESIVFLGAQVETGIKQSSYIRTNGAQALRAKDEIGLVGLDGVFDVTARYGDDTTEVFTDQIILGGYWPEIRQTHLNSLRLNRK